MRTQILHAARRRRPFRTIAALGTLTAVSGCSALKPKEDPTRSFYLKESRPNKLVSSSKLRVLVGEIVVPEYIDKTEIVTAGADNELKVAEYFVWAEPLGNGVSRVLATNLSRLLDSPTVVPYPDVDSINYDFRVPVVLRRFVMAADGKVHLEVSYVVAAAGLTSAADGKSSSRSVIADVADPNSYSAIADAMSRALADLSVVIAKDVLAEDRKRKAAEREKEEAEKAAAAALEEPQD